VTADLQAYGWQRGPGGIWRRPKPHLAVVPEPVPEPRETTPSRGKRDYRTITCECGARKVPRARRCRPCADAAVASPNPRAEALPADEVIEAVFGTIARNLAAIPAPRLPVHLCDCGCLLRLDEALCPECRDWAERAATAWSWSA